MKKLGSDKTGSPSPPKSDFWWTAILLLTILLGVAWRSAGISQWPGIFHITRQYDDALLARRFWLRVRLPPLSPGEQLWLDHAQQPVIEPPILEWLTVCAYLATGKEIAWFSGVISSCFWLAGSWFVFDTARRLTDNRDAALLSLILYLLAPLGIILSCSFQPEALMIFAFVVALWFLVRHGAETGWRATVRLGLIFGAAMLVKPGFVFFPLWGGLVASRVPTLGWRRALLGARTWAVVGLMLLPSLVYAYFFLAGHSEEKFLPHLLLDSTYYRGLWQQVDGVVGWTSLAAAILGACLLHRDRGWLIGYGLLAGYVAFCATFTYHASTHSYYHAILVPSVALCAAPLAGGLRGFLARRPLRAWQGIVCLAVLAVSLVQFSLPAAEAITRPANFDDVVNFYQQIGKICGTGTEVVYLGPDYGRPLEFHGWLVVVPMPTQGDMEYWRMRGVPPEIASKRLSFDRAGFFVITSLSELKRQPDLESALNGFSKVAEGPSLLIYNLHEPSPSRRPPGPPAR